MFSKGEKVSHPKFGVGTVRMVDEHTLIIRFDHGIEECLNSDLTIIKGSRTGNQ